MAVAMSAVLLSSGVAAATTPSWTIQPTVNEAGATSSVLSAVSCTSSRACVAVGYYSNGSNVDVVFAEALTTAGWAPLSPVIPPGASSSELSGVSCLSATSCTAVGSYNNGTKTVTLIEHWNGETNTWAVQPTTPPAGSGNSQLTAVSVDPGTAVGYYSSTAGPELPLAERWNGKSWMVQKMPNPAGAAQLNGVSCTSSGASCTAVGYYYIKDTENTGSLSEHWNGKAWVIQKTENPGTAYNNLYGVSCSSATACTAVGYYVTGSPLVALAERWNGKSWALQSLPAGVSNPWMTGVSCPSATACTAAGFADASPQATLAEQWNGKTNKWAVQATPTGSANTVLNGVSCLSATECVAVGSELTSGNYATLAELYSSARAPRVRSRVSHVRVVARDQPTSVMIRLVQERDLTGASPLCRETERLADVPSGLPDHFAQSSPVYRRVKKSVRPLPLRRRRCPWRCHG